MPNQFYCNTFTSVNPPSAREMSELVCNGCPTILVYNRGATNIRCPNCRTLNSTRSGANQVGQLQCGRCPTTLAYPLGTSTVGCPRCRHVNPVRILKQSRCIWQSSNHSFVTTSTGAGCSKKITTLDARPQTVLVENPKTLDDKGKLVSNVAVGVASWKR